MLRTLRYLRIAVTALSLTACVLLIALWVRSYWRGYMLEGFSSNFFAIAFSSVRGVIGCEWRTSPLSIWSVDAWALNSYYTHQGPNPGKLGFYYVHGGPGSAGMNLPYWFIVLVMASTAIAPWLRWRFSLRTLLIATTLVAVALAAIVYASR